jgi:hypothetical protein
MKMKNIYPSAWIFFLLISMPIGMNLIAQGSDDYKGGLKIKLDSTGKKYVRFIMWNQIWMRSIHHNPGTQVNGENVDRTWDVGARRLRFLAYAQVSQRYLILTHFGINNQSFATGGGSGTGGTGPYGAGKKPQLFFHDAYNEFTIVPENDYNTGHKNKVSVAIGAGLHYWWGLSRMTSASTLNFLAIDAPIVNWPLVEFSDQFVRQFGLYAKGRAGKLNYSMHINKPFATNQTPPIPDAIKGPIAVDNNGNASPAFGGYFDYQFFEQESNGLPFRVGTYVGTKKVFNIGAGFYHTKDGTKSRDLISPEKFNKHDITLLGLDVFADIPIGNKKRNMAVTAYSVFYNYNFGPNYIRTVGLMNPASGFDPNLPPSERTLNGPGNNREFIGTGNILYTQAGLLLPKGNKGKMRIQPFAAHTYKKLEALDDNGHYFDVGANFFIDGHHAKITPQYSTRPLYFEMDGKRRINGTRGEFLLQFQIYL